MKAYLFTYSSLCPPWQAQAAMNDTKAVETWAQPFPNAAIIVSKLNAYDLGAIFRRRLGEAWFLITELSRETVDGYLPGNLWSMVNDAEIAWQPQLPGAALAAS